jgi:hypothetical protein
MPVILATWEAEIWRTVFQDSLGKKKYMTPHFNGKRLGLVVCTSHPIYSRKCKIEGSQSRPAWAESETLSPK